MSDYYAPPEAVLPLFRQPAPSVRGSITSAAAADAAAPPGARLPAVASRRGDRRGDRHGARSEPEHRAATAHRTCTAWSGG